MHAVRAFLLALCGAATFASAQSVHVGVLDRPACHADQALAIRVVFVKDASVWRVATPHDMNARTAPTRWTIAFDGRERGIVNTIARADAPSDIALFRRDYVLELSANQSPFVAPSPSAPRGAASPFEGWCEHDASRPLVVVSAAHATDPDHWHRQLATAATTSRVFALFKVHTKSAQFCPKGDDVSTRLVVKPNDVEVVSAYADARGRQLIGMRVKPQLRRCDGPSEDAWQVHWFAVSNELRFMGRGMTLIDAGDFDANGASELLFWYSGYNLDGYVLMTGDLRHRIEYFWSYH